jgi:hypothetical protein
MFGYADYNILRENINTIRKNTEALLQVSGAWSGIKHREDQIYGCTSSPKCRTK